MPATTGPSKRAHVVLPLQAAPDVLRLLVARVDHVLRAGERDLAVDDEQLAVVAQVGALELALERLHRQHQVPLRRPSASSRRMVRR